MTRSSDAEVPGELAVRGSVDVCRRSVSRVHQLADDRARVGQQVGEHVLDGRLAAQLGLDPASCR
jgi:hypothetical protein